MLAYRKRFLFYENDNLLLCPIAHFLALAFADRAFEASSLQEATNILRVQVPQHKKSLTIQWRQEILDIPVLRQSVRTEGGFRTSQHEPLSAAASGRYLRRLGEATGFEHPLSHYAVRRGTGNAVDGTRFLVLFLLLPTVLLTCAINIDAGSVAERDQVMGHANSRTFEFYLNEQVKLDVQAAFLGLPSRDVLLKAVGYMGLTADPHAPTKLTPEQTQAMTSDPKLAKLHKKYAMLSQEICMTFGSPRCPKNSELYKKRAELKRALDKAKSHWRLIALKEARKEHFRTADTATLEAQFLDIKSAHPDADQIRTPDMFRLKERHAVAQILCDIPLERTEEVVLRQRRRLIETMMKLCKRREKRQRTVALPLTTQPETAAVYDFPVRCKVTQCVFCLGSEDLPYNQRVFCWTRPSKMMDHVEKHHLALLREGTQVSCPHPRCKEQEVILNHVSHFKNHVFREHGVALRA